MEVATSETCKTKSEKYSTKQFKQADLVEGSPTFSSESEAATYDIARGIVATNGILLVASKLGKIFQNILTSRDTWAIFREA